MRINVTSHVNINPTLRELGSDELGTYAATSLNRHMQDLIPKRTGQLSEQNVNIRPWEVEYYAPHAVYVYNMSANRNFRKDPHLKAGPQWDKRFVQEKTGYEKFIQDIQNWVNRNI